MGNESDVENGAQEPTAGAGGEDRIEGKIDRDLRDSFPASDPPGWVLGVKRPPKKDEQAGDGEEG